MLKYAGMPILPHAIKKLRVDARRSAVNKKVRTATKRAVKTMRAKPSQENLTKAFSALVDNLSLISGSAANFSTKSQNLSISPGA